MPEKIYFFFFQKRKDEQKKKIKEILWLIIVENLLIHPTTEKNKNGMTINFCHFFFILFCQLLFINYYNKRMEKTDFSFDIRSIELHHNTINKNWYENKKIMNKSTVTD